MSNLTNVTVDKPTNPSIEFDVRMKPEQQKVVELVANLYNVTAGDYIIQNSIAGVPGLFDHIKDFKEQKRAKEAFEKSDSSIYVKQEIIYHCKYEFEGPNAALGLWALSKVAEAFNETPSQTLSSSFFNMVRGDLPRLSYEIPTVQKMEEAFEEEG